MKINFNPLYKYPLSTSLSFSSKDERKSKSEAEVDEYIKKIKQTTKIKKRDEAMFRAFLKKVFSADTVFNLIKDGFKKTGINYETLLDEVPSKDADIILKKLQNNAGYLLQIVDGGYDKEFDSYAKIVKTFNNDSNVSIQRRETRKYGIEEEASIKDLNKSIRLIDRTGCSIDSLLEFNYAPKLEETEITYTKPSDLLKGAYEISKFYLKDFAQSADVAELIQKGEAKSNIILSKVTQNKNGDIELSEHYNYEGCDIKRNYLIKKDKNGNITEKRYKYIIEKQGEKLLNLNRTWQKVSNSRTITTINDEKFIADFDDETKILTISNDDLILSRLQLVPDEAPLDMKYDKFYEFCKTLNADTLFDIMSTVDKISITDNLEEACFIAQEDQDKKEERIIRIYLNQAVICHEAGHALFYAIDCENPPFMDKELIQIYNKEMDAYRKNYPEPMVDFVNYFSNEDGGGEYEVGLEEVIAEAYMLLSTYNNDKKDDLITRSHCLVRYFPQTIACIAKKFGYE